VVGYLVSTLRLTERGGGMKKFKCHNCGTIDSLRENSKLLCEKQKGLSLDFRTGTAATLDQYYIYCRSCFYVNVYQPGWIGNIKFNYYLEGNQLFAQVKSHFVFQLFNSINKAMKEDGIIPKNWTPYDDEIENRRNNQYTDATTTLHKLEENYGYICILTNHILPNYVMICLSLRTPQKKADESSGAFGGEFQVAHYEIVHDPQSVLDAIHKSLEKYLVNKGQRFYRLSNVEAIRRTSKICKKYCN
jgi:hypothetical protein